MATQLPLQLRLDAFEGPLDLLLSLIEHRRLPITQVSLAQVADQYLAQVHARPEIDPDLLSDFLLIGGRLLLLKSRALLPNDTPDPAAEEVATDLAERLATYRVFRAAAEALRALEARGARTYPAAAPPRADGPPPPLLPASPDDLLAVWRRLLAARPPAAVDLPGVARASVDERRARILDLLREHPSLSFRAVAGDTVDGVVASFLAVLELFRRGLLGIAQAETFGDLRLTRPA